MLMLLSNIECADKFAFGNSMKGILQIHQELLYNCKASAKTFQNLTNFLRCKYGMKSHDDKYIQLVSDFKVLLIDVI